MRKRMAFAMVGVLGAVAWALWPTDEPAPPVEVAAAAPPVEATRFDRARARAPRVVTSGDPLFAEAARGDFGPEYRERVCSLCRVGYVTGPTCDSCDPPEEEETVGRLVVDVVDPDGRSVERARIRVTGCSARSVERGVYEVAEGRCTLEAMRRDGALWARSEPVTVSVSIGAETYAQLELRSERTGGLGVSVGQRGGGIEVLAVMPGTPADQMGLEVGDLIIEVDGQPTSELGLHGFIRTMTGPEGSEVDFVVQFEDDDGPSEEALSIVRTFLDRS